MVVFPEAGEIADHAIAFAQMMFAHTALERGIGELQDTITKQPGFCEQRANQWHAQARPALMVVFFHCGGAGARPGKDGLSATAFPSGVRTIPVEATESVAPVVFYRREFRDGSGGAGKYRGGLGQAIELGGAGANPIALLCNFERVKNPARGRAGGLLGGAGTVSLRSGRRSGRRDVRPCRRATRFSSGCRVAAVLVIRASGTLSKC